MNPNHARFLAYKRRHPRKKFRRGRNDFTELCDLCGKELEGWFLISKNGIAYKYKFSGEFHHKDGDKNNNDPGNFMFLCERCHKRLHDWGMVKRWLRKIGKSVEDLPKADLNPYKGRQ